MNNYSTIGRLTRDPEKKYTATGKAITSFGLAQDVGFGDNKRTIFWDCKLWGERGETFAKFVKKGHRVGITASIDQEEWTDKGSGEQRKKLVLDVRDFTLIERKDSGDAPPQERSATRPPPQQKQDDFGDGPITDGLDGDDIPF